MFIPIPLSDGEVVFITLAHVVNVIRVSKDQCTVNSLVGEPLFVSGQENVEAIIRAIRQESSPIGHASTEPQP